MNAKKSVKKTAGRPAVKRASTRAPARGEAGAGGTLRTVNELMAYAYALEAEASERYTEFADAMESHNNPEVAELFRKLARIEHRHAEQVLEDMGWVSAPAPPHAGYCWEGPTGPEGPESGDITDLHYLMQPYHALQIALHNEKRAQMFFSTLVKQARNAKVRRAAQEMALEEAEHVQLIQEWLKRTPEPGPNWALDPDPPMLLD